MPGAARARKDCAGILGVIISGSCDVIINGKPAARVTDLVSPHKSAKGGKHPTCNPIMTGSCTVLVNGKPIAKQGSITACLDSVIFGSCDVQVP